MTENTTAKSVCPGPGSTAALRQQLHQQVDEIADYCESFDGRFFTFESKLKTLLWTLGRLFISLFLLSRQQRLQKQPQDYVGYRRFTELLRRTLRTLFDEVVYERCYWCKRKGGGGFHPLDVALGLTRDEQNLA